MNDVMNSLVTKMLTEQSRPREYDEQFCRAMRAVASGQLTVDQAWAEINAKKDKDGGK